MVSFLLIGQSNMAGRGNPAEVEAIQNDRLYVLRNARFQKMYVPVNPDRKTSGTCLAESFADSVSREYDADVGLIPCADGGTRLDQWMPGEALFENAVFQTQMARRVSEFAGILWHQGESDSRDGRHVSYEEKCLHIFAELKKRLSLPEAFPILVGGIGDFILRYQENKFKDYVFVNEALQKMARENPGIAFVSAKGLTDKGDSLHFSAASLREFGLRYFESFQKVNTLLKKGETGIYIDKTTEMEKL